MKLLLDENLSPALIDILAEVYPETAHVRNFGLKSALDPQVWGHAANHGYTIGRRTLIFTIAASFTVIRPKSSGSVSRTAPHATLRPS